MTTEYHVTFSFALNGSRFYSGMNGKTMNLAAAEKMVGMLLSGGFEDVMLHTHTHEAITFSGNTDG